MAKNNIFFSMYYLTLATLFNHAAPVYTCEMSCFHRYDPHACLFCDFKFLKKLMFTQFIESDNEEIDITSAVKLSQNEFCRPVNGKIILTDLLLTLFKWIIPGVRWINLDNFNLFILSVQELLWYLAPHHVKYKDRSCTPPSQLIRFCGLNNPRKHGHEIKQIDLVVMESLIGGLATQLEKSYMLNTRISILFKI